MKYNYTSTERFQAFNGTDAYCVARNRKAAATAPDVRYMVVYADNLDGTQVGDGDYAVAVWEGPRFCGWLV